MGLIPFFVLSQEIDIPSEINRETAYEIFGDNAQHAPALLSLIVIIVKIRQKGIERRQSPDPAIESENLGGDWIFFPSFKAY